MVTQTVRHQPYWDKDANYQRLLEFARRYAPLLVPGFSAPAEPEGHWRRVRLDVDGAEGWQYGTERGFKVTRWWELQPRYNEVTVDGAKVEAFGMPERTSLLLTTERRPDEERYVELEVSGAKEAVAAIVRAFRPELAQQYDRTGEQLDDHMEMARSSLAKGEWREAESHALTVLRFRPDDPEVHALLGMAEARLGDWIGARIWLRKAVDVEPNNVEALFWLGRAYLETEEPEKALNVLQQVLEIRPDHEPAARLLQDAQEATERTGSDNRIEQMIDDPDIVAAHKHSINHKDELLASDLCGCFYCLHLYPPTEIEVWIEEAGGGETALCPHCGIDSVIGSTSSFPVTQAFLKSMNRHWFS